MSLAYIGIGSNLGDKGRNCDQALELLGRIPGCRLADRSQWFLTRPVGVNDQDWYLNGVACLETETAGHEILTHLLAIESAMGRVRNEKWGPRIIDLDLLLLGREIIKSSDLQVPHPLMHTRRFVLVPMVQIAPALIHPVLGRTMQDLLEDLAEDGQEVMALEAVTVEAFDKKHETDGKEKSSRCKAHRRRKAQGAGCTAKTYQKGYAVTRTP